MYLLLYIKQGTGQTGRCCRSGDLLLPACANERNCQVFQVFPYAANGSAIKRVANNQRTSETCKTKQVTEIVDRLVSRTFRGLIKFVADSDSCYTPPWLFPRAGIVGNIRELAGRVDTPSVTLSTNAGYEKQCRIRKTMQDTKNAP